MQIVNGVDVKDVAWADTTGVLGFETTGVVQGSDGTDVNSADIAVVPATGHQERVLAAGGDRRRVALPRAGVGRQTRHVPDTAHVTTVRFSKDGTKLFSCGGGDDGAAVGGDPGWAERRTGGRADEPPKQTMEHEGEDVAAPAAASPPQQKKKSRW